MLTLPTIVERAKERLESSKKPKIALVADDASERVALAAEAE